MISTTVDHILEHTLAPYIGSTISVHLRQPDPKRHVMNPVDGVLEACTSTGFVVAGPHYPQWFAYRDLARDQVQITGPCRAAVAQALHERATIIISGRPKIRCHQAFP